MNTLRPSCLLYALLFAVCCLLPACRQSKPEPKVAPSAYTKPVLDYTRAGAHRGPPPVAFSDVTRQAGIDFRHETGAFGQKWMPETMGSGCALFDYDGDGALDLLLVNGTYWPGHEKEGQGDQKSSIVNRQSSTGNRKPNDEFRMTNDGNSPRPTSKLYRNRGDGTFEDVTQRAGLAFPLYGMGCAVGDYDGDGDDDIYLTAVGDNKLLRNDGGRFTDVTGRAGVAGGRWRTQGGNTEALSTSPSPPLPLSPTGGQGDGEWSTGAAWVDADGDGWIDLFVCNYVQWSPETDLFTTIDGVQKSYATPQQYDGSTCRLYRNRGDGTFKDVTQAAGVYNPSGKSMGVAVADFDDDGHPDLVVTNDTQPNFMYRNQGDGTFKDVALASGIAYDEAGRARAGMGVDVASLDNDRALAIAIGNFSREPVSLYRQSGGDVFIDVAGGRRIAQPTLPALTFGLLFLDYDLDGYLDLALSNGHIEPEINRVQKEVLYQEQPQLFWNDGERHFRDVTDQSGEPFARPVVGRGLACGDLDGDGDLDLVLTTNGGPAVLMRNDGPVGGAVRVRLRGAPPNREALGAVVTATAGDLEQRQMVRTGSSYLSQSETTLTLGLGGRSRVDRLSIRWPDGRSESMGRLEAGATYVIQEGKGVVQRIPFRRSPPIP